MARSPSPSPRPLAVDGIPKLNTIGHTLRRSPRSYRSIRSYEPMAPRRRNISATWANWPFRRHRLIGPQAGRRRWHGSLLSAVTPRHGPLVLAVTQQRLRPPARGVTARCCRLLHSSGCSLQPEVSRPAAVGCYIAAAAASSPRGQPYGPTAPKMDTSSSHRSLRPYGPTAPKTRKISATWAIS